MPKTYKERKEEKIKKQKEAEESAKRNEADHQERLALQRARRVKQFETWKPR
jgi:hypothetical protein